MLFPSYHLFAGGNRLFYPPTPWSRSIILCLWAFCSDLVLQTQRANTPQRSLNAYAGWGLAGSWSFSAFFFFFLHFLPVKAAKGQVNAKSLSINYHSAGLNPQCVLLITCPTWSCQIRGAETTLEWQQLLPLNQRVKSLCLTASRFQGCSESRVKVFSADNKMIWCFRRQEFSWRELGALDLFLLATPRSLLTCLPITFFQMQNPKCFIQPESCNHLTAF